MTSLELVCAHTRARLVEMSHRSRLPHLGSALSCVEILVALYFEAARLDPGVPTDPGRDRIILSKGHAASALYATLAARGYLSLEALETFGQLGSALPEHPSPGCVPGVDFATGSLGHGLSVGVGLALGSRVSGPPFRTYVVMSDGECNEGSVWEAALMAAQHRLGSLVAIVDYNKWQATGRSDDVLGLPSLTAKWSAFRWDVREVDGHDLGALRAALAPGDPCGAPRAVVAHTVKGRGVSFMADDNNWHYRIPSADEVVRARAELGVS
ncbi:MAG: transketolase [Vicinamibacterales bacterium]|nr:transketolase [Vicinamibacterales bacterium]